MLNLMIGIGQNNMSKCPSCRLCMKWVWVKGKRYLYCDLCLSYYVKVSNRKLEKVPNPNTTEGVYNG
jgi:hypothetical protein